MARTPLSKADVVPAKINGEHAAGERFIKDDIKTPRGAWSMTADEAALR